jgi:transcription antitermination factor NusG
MVWRQIKGQGFEVFYPRLRVHPVNPRARKIKPYFPGYMFVQVDLEEAGISTFQWMPHSLGLVSFGGEPAVVTDALIHAIRTRIEEIEAAGGEIYDGLHQGDRIFIKYGPFAGYEAMFDVRVSGTERVRIFLKWLSGRLVPLELDIAEIQKAP